MAYTPLPVAAYRCRPLFHVDSDHALAVLASIWRTGAYHLYMLSHHRDYEFSEDCEGERLARLLDELLGAERGSG